MISGDDTRGNVGQDAHLEDDARVKAREWSSSSKVREDRLAREEASGDAKLKPAGAVEAIPRQAEEVGKVVPVAQATRYSKFDLVRNFSEE